MRTRDAQIAIENDFTTRWASETPIAYDNVIFDSAGLPEWTLLNVQFVNIGQVSLGMNNAQQRQRGFMNIQFYTPLKKGSQRALELIDKATDLYSGIRVGEILFRTPDVNILGETEKWYVTDMDFDFSYEFVRP